MSPFSPVVLGGAAVVSAPALWAALVEGTDDPSVALGRYLVSIVLVWAALGGLAMLVGPVALEPDPAPAEDEERSAG